MKNNVLIGLIFFSTPGLMACAPNNTGEETLPPQYISVEKFDGFSPVETSLREYIENQKAVPGPQNICVVVDTKNANESSATALVYWHEGQRLIYWDQPARGVTPSETLIHSRRDLDLRTDVVKNEEDIGSSTYLVSQNWVQSIKDSCNKYGNKYLINKK
jgi:hypothetical protein